MGHRYGTIAGIMAIITTCTKEHINILQKYHIHKSLGTQTQTDTTQDSKHCRKHSPDKSTQHALALSTNKHTHTFTDLQLNPRADQSALCRPIL
jgi:hypothetical protein